MKIIGNFVLKSPFIKGFLRLINVTSPFIICKVEGNEALKSGAASLQKFSF